MSDTKASILRCGASPARVPASRPFEQVHADLGSINGRNFLVILDQLSGWRPWSRSRTATRSPAASSTPSGATSRASGHQSSFRATTAATLPQLSSMSFYETGESPTGSHPPHFPESNGITKAEIKQMKKLLETCWTAGTFDEDKFAKGLYSRGTHHAPGVPHPPNWCSVDPCVTAYPHTGDFLPQIGKSPLKSWSRGWSA